MHEQSFGDSSQALTLIIPVKDDVRLFDLLNCLPNCERADKVHVLVACNGSTREFADKVRCELARLPSAGMVEIEKPGIAAALNEAIIATKTPVAFIVDSDCMFDSLFLDTVLDEAAQGRSFRVNILYTGENRFARMTADWRNRLNAEFNNGGSFYNPGLGIALNDFLKIGPYRTDIKHSFDSEFSDRAHRLGIKCNILKQATLIHRCHEEVKRELSIWKSYGVGRFQRMNSDTWPETGMHKYKRALLGDIPDAFIQKSPLHFLYALSYATIRASGLTKALASHLLYQREKPPTKLVDRVRCSIAKHLQSLLSITLAPKRVPDIVQEAALNKAAGSNKGLYSEQKIKVETHRIVDSVLPVERDVATSGKRKDIQGADVHNGSRQSTSEPDGNRHSHANASRPVQGSAHKGGNTMGCG